MSNVSQLCEIPVMRPPSVLLPLLGALALCSCASVPQYIEPSTAPMAKLRVVVLEPQRYFVHMAASDMSSCDRKALSVVGWATTDEPSRIDRRRVGMIDETPPADGILERTIPVGRKLAIGPDPVLPRATTADVLFALSPVAQSSLSAKMPSECRSPVFVPAADSQYEMTIAASSGACEVKLAKLARAADGSAVRAPAETTGEYVVFQHPMKCGR